uniref:CASK interacting protein 1 n=1 Tax=Oncorhynchus kisutch TaxID=8019 RepID=A0A8C7N1Z8_ONCKI
MGKDQELLQAVKTEDLLTVQKLLQRPGKAKLLGSAKRVNVNFQDTDGFAPLHHAALSGNLELISLLLESQATVDIRDQKGMRPLHYAAWQGKAEPMKMLLKSGSSVNGQSDEGQIPLHLSAQHGHYDVSEMLLQHQSNPCIVDNAGKTPLDLACEFGRVGVVQLLLNSNMCVALLELKPGDSTDPNGTSPLHLAAKNGHIDIIRLLIQSGIDINRQTKAGTALHEAALCGKTEAVRLLLDSGINAAVRNTYSQTALDIVYQFSASQASREIKQLLRDASAALQVRALKDYCNNYDLTSLNIKAGDVITVLEQHVDGRWKGCIHDNRTGNDRVGYFPSTIVEVINKRTGVCLCLCACGFFWVLGNYPLTCSTSLSSGSGQSAGSSTHILHAQAEGVKVRRAHTHTHTHHTPLISEAVIQWLSDFQLQVYAPNFISAGYDIATISRMTPEDLTAIGVTKPGHRKKMTSEINKLSVTEWLPDQKPASLAEWLSAIGLSQYQQVLVQNGYENIDFITDITWEDLQEIGIMKLGHQKKLMLAVKRLAEMQRGSEGRSSPRKKPPPITQQQEVMSIENRPPDNEVVTSPKLCTFQDSELSPELQTALIQPIPEVKGQRTRSLSKDPEEGVGPGGRGGGGVPPKKEARTMRQTSQGSQRGSASSKPRPPSHAHSMPAPPYTPPHTPTKKPLHSSTSAPGPSPQAKPKSSPQLIQGERPGSPRSHPLSNAHRGTHNTQTQPGPQPQSGPQPQPGPHPQVSVPLLCLPPEAEGGDGGEMGEAGEAPLKKRANSLNRYAGSDGEGEERGGRVAGGGTGKYATVTHRVSRSHSVRNQDKNVNRSQSQSIALRPKKKGPPPPPPKRSSSAISNSNLADTHTPTHTHAADRLLGVPYNPQRRASDLGVSVETVVVDTGSAGSVRSIAAMLEMSSIGGGAKGMAIQRNFLQVGERDAIGLDGEVVNRRRTISGPVTELVAAARRDRPTPNLPFAAERKQTVKRQRGEGEEEGETELSQVDATATLKRRPRCNKPHPNGSRFTLTESSTVKRRPKSRDKEPEGFSESGIADITGTSKTWVCRLISLSHTFLSLAPSSLSLLPLSLTPSSLSPLFLSLFLSHSSLSLFLSLCSSLSLSSSLSLPLSLPLSLSPSSLPLSLSLYLVEAKKIPPPVSPKPAPPPTAPKPTKHLHSITTPTSPPYSSSSPKPPTSPAQSPHTPLTPQSPHTPLTPTPPPIKPPRSSIGGVSVDMGTVAAVSVVMSEAESVHQKLEETSASLAAALKAVEDKIREEQDWVAEEKTTVSILDDIGSMFDDLADQLDAMLE